MAFEMRAAFAICLALFSLRSVMVMGEGGVECEKLPVEMCAFSVSSSGARCVLEKKYTFVPSTHESSVEYQCQSSGVMAEKMMEWIESEECLQSCGLQRMSVGMSTDDLSAYSDFTSKLCSDKCQNSCPNIVNLYLNLAAGEGIYLPHLCEAHKTRSRRMMFETVASGPAAQTISLAGVAAAPL
ncbi:uncharacterized protein LOC131074584 isoform X2 [Cryptomeria japonica]|uniref:uncharacterized protein LOC131074584 isoform X2 n=1 Tax=Cryptomeria japonica TaxID=3369 RepID=UPI0025AD6577|nr:uncharacterized protein LOC131074584 isoform X2 [Cryptomeria japonica]